MYSTQKTTETSETILKCILYVITQLWDTGTIFFNTETSMLYALPV